MSEHKEIWLQVDEPEVSWCQDKIHDSDVKYLLASDVKAALSLADLFRIFEEQGCGCALISDDAGNWAVSGEGFQNVPDDPPQDIETSFFIEKDLWKPTIREALIAFCEDIGWKPE